MNPKKKLRKKLQNAVVNTFKTESPMEKKSKNQAEVVEQELENVEWGENCQERIVDHGPRHQSLRHTCKGRGCDSRFEKL